MRIVSVHFPKAAGSSLKAAWIQAFGRERVLDLYTDNPADTRSRIHIDPEYVVRDPPLFGEATDVVHGHFRPHRYAHIQDAFFVTFLRHPIDNLLSIYHFWQTFVRIGDPMHEYFLDFKLDPVATARLPLLRHLMSRTYFDGFDMNRFSFIGDMATYSQDLAVLSTLIGRPLPHLRENVTAERSNEPRSSYEDLRGDTSLRETLGSILAEDIAFYERVQRMRRERWPSPV
jgi:hypothetical protein